MTRGDLQFHTWVVAHSRKIMTAGCYVDLDTGDPIRQRPGDSAAYQAWLAKSLTVLGSGKISKEADECSRAILD